MVSREEWTTRPGTSPVVKGLAWFTDGSRTQGTVDGVYGQPLGRRVSISISNYGTAFWAKVYAILECAYEIQMNPRSEMYVSICSEGQAALQAIQDAKTMSPLVQQCQKALNVSLPGTEWDYIGFLDMLG